MWYQFFCTYYYLLLIIILMLEHLYLNHKMRRGTERESVIWTSIGWKDGGQRDNKAAGTTNTPTISSLHTHTHAHTRTHAWLTYVWKPSHVCMRGRHHVKWASVHVQHAASGKAKKERGREIGRESTEDTLLLLSGTISVFLPYTHTGQKANYSAYCLCSIVRQHQTQAWSSQRPRSHQHAHTQAHHPLRTEPLQKIRQAGEKQS